MGLSATPSSLNRARLERLLHRAIHELALDLTFDSGSATT